MDEQRASSMRMTAYQSLGAGSTTEVGKDDPSRGRLLSASKPSVTLLSY